MKIGYARVSTVGQSLNSQIEILEAKGCNRIFTEKKTGKNRDREELKNMLKQITHGDIVLVTSLDRLSRNTKDLLEILENISDRGASFKSIKEEWADTTSPAGKLMITILGGIAQFQREQTLERANEGRKIAKKRKSVKFGRKPKLTPVQKEIIREKFKSKEKTQNELANNFGVSRSTVQRILKGI